MYITHLAEQLTVNHVNNNFEVEHPYLSKSSMYKCQMLRYHIKTRCFIFELSTVLFEQTA